MSTSPISLSVSDEIKISLVEKSLKNIEDSIRRTDQLLMSIDCKLDKRFDDLNNRLWSNFIWIVGFGIGLYGSLFAIIAHSLKWF